MNLDDYITAAEAAQLLDKTVSMIGRLCRAGKFIGAEKKGTAAWLIPRDSVLNYTPGPRGPKPRKAKLAAEKAAILEEAKGARAKEEKR
jgi:hypothetical protein